MRNRIKELRARHNMTQADLAKIVNVRRETIVYLEASKYNPSLKLMEVSLTWLILVGLWLVS